MDVSVIIVNYNTKELTRNCIDSIFQHTSGVKFEIILIDNASTDGSAELFEEDRRIILIKCKANLGFGKANNLGYRYAKGKYIFFLNSDTLLLNNAISFFFNKMEMSSNSIGCMGCILQDASSKKTHSFADFPSVGNLLFYQWPTLFSILGFNAMQMDNIKDEDVNSSFFKVDYITGADLFVRRSVIEDYGLFDPAFFMYYEEAELQYRYNMKGVYSYIYDRAKIIHLEGMSFAGVKRNKNKSLVSLKSQLLYINKTQPVWKSLLFRFILILFLPLSLYKNRYNFIESARYCYYIFSKGK